jgi:hypothetical protein
LSSPILFWDRFLAYRFWMILGYKFRDFSVMVTDEKIINSSNCLILLYKYSCEPGAEHPTAGFSKKGTLN